MPKKTTILIVILAVITGVLIFLAVRSDQSQELTKKTTTTTARPTIPVVRSFAYLAFSTSQLDVSKIATPQQSIDITIDTYGKPVAGTQLELSYDPKILTNVTVTNPLQGALFGQSPIILINHVDPALGRISYATAISASDSEKIGKGPVATLHFTVNKPAGATETQITFLDKSAVTTLSSQKSVLAGTRALRILLVPATPSPSH